MLTKGLCGYGYTGIKDVIRERRLLMDTLYSVLEDAPNARESARRVLVTLDQNEYGAGIREIELDRDKPVRIQKGDQ